MKHLLLTLSILLGFSTLQTLQGQNAIGVIAGVSVFPDVIGKGAEPFDIFDKRFQAARIGIRGNIKLNESMSIETGIERFNEFYDIRLSNDDFRYGLSYLQIPLLLTTEFAFKDAIDWTPYIAMKTGLSTNILRSETINNTPSIETHFNGFVPHLTGAIAYGIQNEYIRLTANLNVQLTLNSIIDETLVGGKARSLQYMLYLQAAYPF